MIIVNPGDSVEQHRNDVVVYRLPFASWSSDLERPSDKEARVTLRIVTGDMLTVKALPYVNGTQAQDVRVSGGGRKRGIYEIMRTVKSSTEVRVRSFTLRVNP